VSWRTGTLTETFNTGRRSFVHEARLLARFDHRSLLKVYQFWEANGTAYMVMPYLSGQTLKQVRHAMPKPPSEAWLLRVMLPLLDALERLHAESVLHRDISPDNILLPDDGADPILLDFGAARRAIGDHTQAITAILKPRFAPIEQYGESRGLRQGPWTDLYALGAVMHYLVLGRTPPQATTRAVSDDYQPLVDRAPEHLSRNLLAAIDWSLRVHPQDRPQTATEMRAVVQGARAVPPPSAPPPARPVAAAPVNASPATSDESTVVIEFPGQAHVKTIQLDPAPLRPRTGRSDDRESSGSRRRQLVGWLSAASVLAMASIVFVLWPRPSELAGDELPREEVLPDPAPAVVAPVATAALQPAAPASREPALPPATARPGTTPTGAAARALQPSGRALPSPSDVCANSNVFTRWRCIEQECAKPARAGHPECAKPQAPAGRREGTRNAN
jgi:serine/threonine protein kinase